MRPIYECYWTCLNLWNTGSIPHSVRRCTTKNNNNSNNMKINSVREVHFHGKLICIPDKIYCNAFTFVAFELGSVRDEYWNSSTIQSMGVGALCGLFFLITIKWHWHHITFPAILWIILFYLWVRRRWSQDKAQLGGVNKRGDGRKRTIFMKHNQRQWIFYGYQIIVVVVVAVAVAGWEGDTRWV